MFSLTQLKVILAPMYRVGTPEFRAACAQAGAELTYHVMLAQSPPAHVDPSALSLDGRPTAIQLIGSDPHIMAVQAATLEAALGDQLALIDINLGCPIERITSLGAGAALMQDMPLVRRILTSVVAAVQLPVTAKIRKGYHDGEDSAVEFALLAQDCGVAAITVHGRTVSQHFDGQADKTTVARVKQALQIPVFATGDVYTPADVLEYLNIHTADAVMVASGARNNPQIFQEIKAALQAALCQENL